MTPTNKTRYDCPACDGKATVPHSSFIRQPRPTNPDEVWVQGTCDCCGSTRTQWVEDTRGNVIRSEVV